MIRYKAGYKYQLVSQAKFQTTIKPEKSISTQFIRMTLKGMLTIKPGYAWDGASGPTINSLNSQQASLCHDALYQLLRENHLTGEGTRRKADKLFYELLRNDGMSKIRAKIWWRSVRRWAKNSAVKGRPILEAP